MGVHVLNLQHRCHCYAQKDAPDAITSSAATGDAAGDSVKISTVGQQCCRFMPLTLPPMRLRLKARPGSKEQAQAQRAEVDAAEWINRVVKDPLVEIDPVTMAQHLLARKNDTSAGASSSPGAAAPVMETISSSQQPLSHFAMAPRGLGSVLLALGVAIALASLAAAVHLFRSRHQQRRLEGVAAGQQEPQPLAYASSDEEGKLDLLRIVQQEEPAISSTVAQQGPKFMNQGGAISLKTEVVIAAAAAAAAAAVETMKQLNISTAEQEKPTQHIKPEVAIAAAAAAAASAAAAETMKRLNISTSEQEKPTQYIKPEVVIAAAANLVQQVVAAAQVISKVDLEEPPEVISPKPEVVKAPAAEVQAAVETAAAAAPPVISPKPEVVKAPAAEVQAAVAAPPPPPVISPKPEVVKVPAAEVQAAAAPPPPAPQVISKVEQKEPPQVIPKPEVVKAAAETIEVQEEGAAAQVIGKVEQKEQPPGVSPKPEVDIAAAALAIELETSAQAEFNDEGHVNKVVITDVVVDKRIAITGASAAQEEVHSMATSNKRQAAVNPVPLPPSLLDSTAAPEDLSSNNKMDRRSVPLDRAVRSKNLSDHSFKNSYLTFPSFGTKNFMRDGSSSGTGDAGKDDLQDKTTSSSASSSEEDEMIYDEEKRESLKKVVQAAAPAMAVGAGAVSVLTGVDGAFEMVGLAATASFISFELLWADAREELWREVKKISDHRKLWEFFKARKIIQSDKLL